ncbi:hypothetical protein CIRMBP1298_00595 [Enterococcus cecorum]|nr:hypothetical protein CIRMBP1298_00595 [Enterococcus cecorum]
MDAFDFFVQMGLMGQPLFINEDIKLRYFIYAEGMYEVAEILSLKLDL